MERKWKTWQIAAAGGLAASGLAAIAAVAHASAASDPASIQAALTKRLPKTEITSIDCKSIDGVCEIQARQNLFYIDHLRAAVPDARFLHVQREGAQVVGSLYRAARDHPAWRPFLSLERCVDRWDTARRESERWRGDPRHLHVSYEALVREPRGTLRHVLAFLGCETDDALWSRYRTLAGELLRPDEPWKAGNLEPLRARDAFGDVLDASQRRWVECALAARASLRRMEQAQDTPVPALPHTDMLAPRG